ncbi:hypothetical protein BGW38_005992, partial [Lunasporangiospora selenospora]
AGTGGNGSHSATDATRHPPVITGPSKPSTPKKSTKKRRFSYSKAGMAPGQGEEPHPPTTRLWAEDLRRETGGAEGHTGGLCSRSIRNSSSGVLVDRVPKCCSAHVQAPASAKAAGHSQSASKGPLPAATAVEDLVTTMTEECLSQPPSPSTKPPSPITTTAAATRAAHYRGQDHPKGPLHDHDPTPERRLVQREHEAEAEPFRPRVCKMLEKHSAVRVDWRIPEPIKAGGEMLRGFLIITAKDTQDSEIKVNAVAKKHGNDSKSRSKKDQKRRDKLVWVEHIEVDLTGIEEVTTGAGLLSRTRTSRHCFLHKTKVLQILDMKCTHDHPSPSSSASITSGRSESVLAVTTATPAAVGTAFRKETASKGELPSVCQPGCIVPGTQQGITFQMRVPEKVGGPFKTAHASISYQLTAHIHIRIGKEAFILQHPVSVSLFELVQIRSATKITSANEHLASSKRSGVRFVIPKANSVLGTAAIRPYSLWGLGPATSSQSHGSNGHSKGSSNHHHYSQSGGIRRNGSYQQRQGSPLKTSPTSCVLSGSTDLTRSHTHTPTSALSTLPYRDTNNSLSIEAEHGTTTAKARPSRGSNGELLSAHDQYRLQQQQQQRLEGARPHHARHVSRREHSDGLDEVGFGAHIDKSVAAAGDNVSLDMFVLKSDLMKVVDIKVSLVETLQIFSLLDEDDIENTWTLHAAQYNDMPRRKLLETHVVKIAKDYVPAHSEESHANDNHLKGYYEDYEDSRTTKTLSMYKLGMHIPETALTILDRELIKVEYVFVIKFFFKGRMGAFLELPIEIVSQYNHNRISTISGAISCVSNSVQIALPPVPILIKRSDSTSSSETSTDITILGTAHLDPQRSSTDSLMSPSGPTAKFPRRSEMEETYLASVHPKMSRNCSDRHPEDNEAISGDASHVEKDMLASEGSSPENLNSHSNSSTGGKRASVNLRLNPSSARTNRHNSDSSIASPSGSHSSATVIEEEEEKEE